MKISIPETPGRVLRLGRHVHFDEHSRAHQLGRTGSALVTKIWQRTVPVFSQGHLGSCTANGALGVIATAPFYGAGTHNGAHPLYNEALAKKVYSAATGLDDIVGVWPPHDTGSSVLAAMKALKGMKLIAGYRWCLGLPAVLEALSHHGPVAVGVTWHAEFDVPDQDGHVKLTGPRGGSIEGGHAFELHGVDVENKIVWATNSWGSSWGKHGTFSFSWADLDVLLKDNGEAATVVMPA